MAEAKQKAVLPPLWKLLRAWPVYIGLVREFSTNWLLPSLAMKRRPWPLMIGLGYIVLINHLGGLTNDHIVMGMLSLLDYYNPYTRRFLRYFLPFILTGVAFDSMRYYYWQGIEGHVHVAGPYYRDLKWFGIPDMVNGALKILTPNEFFAIHNWKAVDLLTGFAYLVFVAEYLFAGFLLFFKNEFLLLKRFGWSFLVVNIMGFITYFIYPAAPPWYVTEYGLGPARMDAVPSAAAAARFDEILGTHFFDQVYGRGIDVFGAYPSLHVAYPFLVAWAMFQNHRFRMFRLPAIGFYFLMCFSAVYLQHHYVVDIILGTLYAMVVSLTVGRYRFGVERS